MYPYLIKHKQSSCRLYVLDTVNTSLSDGTVKLNYKCKSVIENGDKPFICDGDYIANDWVKE